MIFLNGLGVHPRAERAETKMWCNYSTTGHFGKKKHAPNAIHIISHQLVGIIAHNMYKYTQGNKKKSEKECRLSPVSKRFWTMVIWPPCLRKVVPCDDHLLGWPAACFLTFKTNSKTRHIVEILHHLGCIKHFESWDNLPTSTGAGFLPSTGWCICERR